MLCQACSDLLNWKSARWKGSYKATFDSGDGSGQPESTTLDPEGDSSDDVVGFFRLPTPTNWVLDESEDYCFDPSKSHGLVHHLSGREFLTAAHQGCRLCLLLVSRLSPEQRLEIAREPEDVDTSSADYDYVVGCVLMEGFRVPGEWGYNGCYNPHTLHLKNGPIYFDIQFFASKIQEPLPALDVSYPKAVGWGEASVSLVRRWIAACEEHENCRTRSLTDIYKTQGHPRFARIVDVQDGSSDPRLADADQVPAGAIYMTLSHCWGDPNHKPLTLTLDTLAPFKKGIPWNTLPKTFADAIVFTRNMGIRYIWIDSLCIIQDCADDWASQSAVMCEIYTGSYLNLAATAAADCRGGLFAERDERLVQPLRVTQPPPPGKSSSIGDLFRYYDAVDTGEWQRDVEDAPLCQRGWIVQERVLSRRCLHFGKRQLYWECTSMMASESVPLGYPDSDWGFKSFDPLLPNRTSTGTALVETWGLLLDKYTRAGLTEETDKLVAIAGLAKALAAQSGIQYRSGLWNYRLEQQLLWFAESPLKRPDVFRAPSWSWASTNSTICFNTYKEAHAITISSVPVSSASFTTFKSSPITIRGVLIPGMLSMDDKIDGGLRVLRARRKLIGTTDARHSSWDASFTPDSDSEQDNRGPVLLLPTDIGIEASMYLGAPTDGRRCIVDMTGIVLKATGVKGTLRRVGYFSVRGVFPRQHPLRKVWLLDHYTAMKPWTEPSNVEIGGCKVTPLTKYLDNPSKTNPLEGVSEDLYHHYEQIGDSGDQAHAALDREFDWSRVFSGGFTFDLV